MLKHFNESKNCFSFPPAFNSIIKVNLWIFIATKIRRPGPIQPRWTPPLFICRWSRLNPPTTSPAVRCESSAPLSAFRTPPPCNSLVPPQPPAEICSPVKHQYSGIDFPLIASYLFLLSQAARKAAALRDHPLHPAAAA